MKARSFAAIAVATVVVVAGIVAPIVLALASGTPNVTTAGYSALRDNWDSNESGLSPSVIQSASFGQIFSTHVTGAVYAQPLVVNGTVIVTTERARAYGINATTGVVEWRRTFGKPFQASTIGCSDLAPYIGSTSTPVIDPSTGIIYLTTRLETGPGGLSNAHWYLEALSSSTGAEAPGFPVEITGTPSNTPGVPFNDAFEMQRPGLLLLGGTVYAAFASDCDITPYRGIVAGVSTTTHSLTTMWSDESGVGTDQDSQAGIWQSGGGLVSEGANNIILTSGNGVSPQPAASDAPPATLSESIMALTVGTSGALTPTQFFAPSNAATLDANDEDLGAGGPIALPPAYFGTTKHPELLVQVSKDGRIFLVDAKSMGGFKDGPKGTDDVLQELGPFGGVWGDPATYGGQGGWVYVLESGGGGYLRALSYGLDGQGTPQLTSMGTSTGSFGYTSGSPLVTSYGTTPGSAVVWGVYTSGPSGAGGQLRAYGAVPSNGVLPLLWSAPIGAASKFSVPTAWDGRVFVGTRSGRLIAFGSSAAAPIQAPSIDFGSVPVGSDRTVTLNASATTSLTLTGPVTVSGYQGVTGPTPGGSGGAAGTTTSTTVPPGATAGPTQIPPSGTAPITGSVFSIQQPQVGTSLAAGANVALRVTFAPTHPGPVVANLSIPTSDGTHSVSVSGYGTAPGLLVSAQPLAFGTVLTGSGGKSLSLTFSNSWDRPEALTGFGSPGVPYEVSGAPPVGTLLAPQQSVTISVRFDPGTAGSYPSQLAISTAGGSATLPVSGTGATGTAHLAVSSATVDAGAVPVGHTVTVSFDVGNSGTVALIVTRAIAPSGAFSAPLPVPEGTTIDPGTYLHQTVTFRPTAVGPTASQYEFNSDDGQGPVVVTLTGMGT